MNHNPGIYSSAHSHSSDSSSEVNSPQLLRSTFLGVLRPNDLISKTAISSPGRAAPVEEQAAEHLANKTLLSTPPSFRHSFGAVLRPRDIYAAQANPDIHRSMPCVQDLEQVATAPELSGSSAEELCPSVELLSLEAEIRESDIESIESLVSDEETGSFEQAYVERLRAAGYSFEVQGTGVLKPYREERDVGCQTDPVPEEERNPANDKEVILRLFQALLSIERNSVNIGAAVIESLGFQAQQFGYNSWEHMIHHEGPDYGIYVDYETGPAPRIGSLYALQQQARPN
ncbi:unnamed protein product, partial [Mesorhabditis spiculigera]